MSHLKYSWVKLAILGSLFLLSGFLSSYLYYQLSESGGAFLPGLLYTSATILIFVQKKIVPSLKKLLTYYVAMNLIYIIALFLTFLSSYFGFLVGIFTGGLGALATFILTRKLIVDLNFSEVKVFGSGAAAFIVTDLIYVVSSVTTNKTPLESIFEANPSPDVLFVEVFVFWQLFVGVRLVLTINKHTAASSSDI